MWEKLTSPEGMMQVAELQSILLGTIDEDGQTKVGFAFHSEILEPEQGVRVIVHRDQPVLVGTWDCLSAMDDDVDYDNHAGYDKEGEYDEE